MEGTVFVVGAGPAGLFAAQKIALADYPAVVFNRDIKPGGLAEYGIYPVKDKMKFGLRKQFAKVLGLDNVHYFGHVKIGTESGFSLEDLRALNPSAIIFSCGAQGYNQLGLPGETARGVYSAKDLVYHYNQLPPYAAMDFSTGKRIAVIGMGNVAVDIMRWLLIDSPIRQTEEIIVIARRGPFEAKFGEKEIAYVEGHIGRDEFLREMDRVRERCAACNQEVSLQKIGEATFPFLNKPDLKPVLPKIRFRFLSSPKEIIAGPDGRIQTLVVTENNLVLSGEENTVAKATEATAAIEVDTLIFAVGDKQDPSLGLPMGATGYMTRPNPGDPKEPVYELYDPAAGKLLEGCFVVGWARRASEGLVGVARHDGEVGAGKALEYLKSAPVKRSSSVEQIRAELAARGIRVVSKSDLALLGQAEAREAQARGLLYFKYSDDESMLNAIAEEKVRAMANGAGAN